MNDSSKVNHTNGHTVTDGAPDLDTTNGCTSVKSPGALEGKSGVNVLSGSVDQHSGIPASTHSVLVYNLFKKLQGIVHNGSVKLNGEDLDIPTVVAVSRYVSNTNPSASVGFQKKL